MTKVQRIIMELTREEAMSLDLEQMRATTSRSMVCPQCGDALYIGESGLVCSAPSCDSKILTPYAALNVSWGLPSLRAAWPERVIAHR